MLVSNAIEREYAVQTGRDPYVMYAHVMGPTAEYVKWLEARAAEHVEPAPSAATNIAMDAILLADAYRDTFPKSLTVYQVMGDFIEWLQAKQHQ